MEAKVDIKALPELSKPEALDILPLPWEKSALAPFVSEETVNFHYGKHHNGYVVKLKSLVAGTPNASKSVLDLVKTADGATFNCAAQHWNHSFYWNCLAPNTAGDRTPSGKLGEAISKSFGSFDGFKDQFSTKAAGHFASGWAWLCKDAAGNLKVVDTHDATNPIRTEGIAPLLTCDVWEHAYYIDYRNDRAAYINSFWNLVNWDYVAKLYEA